MIKILAARFNETHNEYVLSGYPSNASSADIRDTIFIKLKKSLLKDYEFFTIYEMGNKMGNSPEDESNYLKVKDEFKDNLAANIRVDNTLYPQFKILRVFSKDLDKLETLYGNTVREYLDKRVREAIS